MRWAAGLVVAAALAGGVAVEASPGGALHSYVFAGDTRVREAVQTVAPELAPVYEARRYAPIWVKGQTVRPEARELVALIASAKTDGLDPERYGLSRLKQDLASAQSGDPASLAQFEAEASHAFADYIFDLHSPPSSDGMIFTDPAAAGPPLDRLSILRAAADGPSLHAQLISARQMNPIYDGLRQALAQYRARRPGQPPDQKEQLILVNLNRARALPANPGRRYIVVDVTAATLWMYQDGKPVDSMKVVVGKQSEPTPIMAGMIRYALFNPYWNVPEDLVRDELAPKVLAGGPGVIAQKHMETLYDWSPDAKVLDPAKVDWSAVAAGQQDLRVRQVPGPANMMGKVKFMLPNKLGIYLHDTPNKALFAQDQRWFSSGCVRLEDADRLGRWLLGGMPQVSTPDYRANLAQPVPVYITYFTVAPGPTGAVFRQDIYGRDEVSLAQFQRQMPNAA